MPRYLFLIFTLLSILPPVASAYDTVIPYSEPLLTLLIIACVAQLFIIIGLYKARRQDKRESDELSDKFIQLEKRLRDRSEKLNALNNQLYDEIAKHEITEELLRETQDYIQNIINSMPSILIGVTRDGMITHWNMAAQNATGIRYEKALGRQLADIAPELDIYPGLIERAINLQKSQRRENRQQGHGSQATYNDLTIYPLLSVDIEGAVIRIDDVTMRVRLETMMIQNEKMNSLGELAAGVAHEINNPLGTILQNVQNLKRRFSTKLPANQTAAQAIGISLDDLNDYLTTRKIFTLLSDIKDAGERATIIVKNMLEFSRAQHKQFDHVNLALLLQRATELALHSINAKQNEKLAKAAITISTPKENKLVYCSGVEIQQVILNLISNAHQAHMDSHQSQRLQIQLTLHFTDNDAIIEITDNGPGMDEWTRRHIFDPFFTTKEVGKGTGLGLSVSYFIITEHHQGSITVDSNPDEGTQFTITLPLEESV